MSGDVKRSDSAIYKGNFYGILNAPGDFWTPLGFASESAAKRHIVDFWGTDRDSARKCLETHRIVPVRIRLSTIADEGTNDEQG